VLASFTFKKVSKISALFALQIALLLATVYGGVNALSSTLEFCAAISPPQMKNPERPYKQGDLARSIGFLLVAGTPPALIVWVLSKAALRVGKTIKSEMGVRVE
jgi:hypothetical protein